MIKIDTYNEFFDKIREGLIVTHDVEKSTKLISFNLSNYGIKHRIWLISKLEFIIKLELSDITDIDLIISLMDNYSKLYGYYTCNFRLEDNIGNYRNYKWSEFNQNLNLDNIKFIIIKFEAKYEDNAYSNNIICPDKLYHLTRMQFLPKIKKIGLYPKSKMRISDHPERIYVFTDLNKWLSLLKILKVNDNCEYALLEIDCIVNKIMLHKDTNYGDGYFTYNNIIPSNITILKENL